MHRFAAREKLKQIKYKISSYLRATKWNSAKAAIQRLEGTLKWRREFGIDDISADAVEPEVGSHIFAVPYRSQTLINVFRTGGNGERSRVWLRHASQARRVHDAQPSKYRRVSPSDKVYILGDGARVGTHRSRRRVSVPSSSPPRALVSLTL